MIRKIFSDANHDAAFKAQGYVILDLLQEKDIQDLWNVFEAVEEKHRYDYVASVVLPDFEMREFVHRGISPVMNRFLPQVLDNYKMVLGSFVSKKASSQYGKFPLHQDPTFTNEETGVGISVWCPLVDVDKGNGCLGVLPGSQYLNNLYRSADMLPYPELVDIIEGTYLKYLPMKAGQVLFMNTRMIHGSPPNLSGLVRPVAAGVAVPADASLLCCYNDDVADPHRSTVFEVPDDFYLTYMMKSMPDTGVPGKVVSRQMEALTEEKLATIAVNQ